MATHFHGGYSHDHDEAGYHEHTGYNSDEPDEQLAEAPVEVVPDEVVIAAADAEREEHVTDRVEAENAAAVAIAEAQAAAAVDIARVEADAAVRIVEADAAADVAIAGATPPTDVDDEDEDETIDEVVDEVRDELEDLDELPGAGDVIEVAVPPQPDDEPDAAGATSPPMRRSRFARARRR